MITVYFMGGLGNQMFQYAAGKTLAERHGVGLAFDLRHLRKHSYRPFMLDSLLVPEADPSAPSVVKNDRQNFLRRFWPQRRERSEPVTAGVRYNEPHFHFDSGFEALPPETALRGHFQSERYFGEIAGDLHNLFLPRQPLSATAAQMLGRIEKSRLPVSVHIRRGDYARLEQVRYHGILGRRYYRDALERIEGIVGPDAELFVFSDDADAAEHVLDFVPPSRLVHVRGDVKRPWEDMALMAKCCHHIIANSSFSWWGAWLNGSPDKVVVAPRAWFRPEVLKTNDTRDLYPPGWILV
jgi:hypothetical protein